MIKQENYISLNYILNNIPEDIEMFRDDIFSCVMESPKNISIRKSSLLKESNYIFNKGNFIYSNNKPIKNGVALLNPIFTENYKDNIALLHRFIAEYDKIQLFFNQIIERVNEKFDYDMSSKWGFESLPSSAYEGEDESMEIPSQLFCDIIKYICNELFKIFSLDKIYLLLSDGFFEINKSTDIKELDIHQKFREIIENTEGEDLFDIDILYNHLCGFYIPITENGYNLGNETKRELSLLQNIADLEMYDCTLTFSNNREISFHGIPSCEINRFMACENIREYIEQNHGRAISLKQIITGKYA